MLRPCGVFLGLVFATLLCRQNAAAGAEKDSQHEQSLYAAMQHLLETGLQNGEAAYRQADRQWRQHRIRFAKNARWHYAWGLVLRHHSRNAEAERVFLQATKFSRPPYYPAWQAGIWLKFVRQDFSGGLRQLEQLIATLARETSRRVPSPAEERAARWIGRALAALENVSLSKREKTKLPAVLRRADTLLKGKLQISYQAGRQDIVRTVQQLDTRKLKLELASKKRDLQRKQKKEKQIASKKSEVNARKKSLKLTAEQWKSWLERQTETARTDLKKVVSELALLAQRRQTIARAIQLSQQEQSNLLALLRLRSISRRSSVLQQQRVEAMVAQRQQDILKYQLQDLKTWQEIQMVRARGAAVLNRYRKARQQFAKATGQLVRQNSALQRLSLQLKEQERNLQRKSPNHLRSVALMNQQQRRFSTYVPFDLQKEKQRLLDSLKKK